MNADAFMLWLDGFIEAAVSQDGSLSAERVAIIKERMLRVSTRGSLRSAQNAGIQAAPIV